LSLGTRATALIAFTITTYISTFIPIAESEAAGRSATPIVNTILNGKGAPKSGVGIDGDFYIDTRSLLLYGPKARGKWPTPANIQGPTGPSGSDGKNGSDGKAISNASSVTGAQGAQGPQGDKGEKGEKGEKGDTGAPGLPGAIGPIGPAGAPGSSGSTGATGASGSNGAQGPVGATGSAGSKGETGTVGPSEVTVIDIPSWTLSSATQFSYSNSSQLGLLDANSNYIFHIHIQGVSAFSSLILGLDILSAGNTLTFSYSRNDFRFATYSSTVTTYAFDAVGTIKTSVSGASLQVRVIDAFGDSGSSPLTLSGKAYITLVGAIK
jgi:hypothetical protein